MNSGSFESALADSLCVSFCCGRCGIDTNTGSFYPPPKKKIKLEKSAPKVEQESADELVFEANSDLDKPTSWFHKTSTIWSRIKSTTFIETSRAWQVWLKDTICSGIVPRHVDAGNLFLLISKLCSWNSDYFLDCASMLENEISSNVLNLFLQSGH